MNAQEDVYPSIAVCASQFHFTLRIGKFQVFEKHFRLRGIAPGRSEAALELGVRQALECHVEKRCEVF